MGTFWRASGPQNGDFLALVFLQFLGTFGGGEIPCNRPGYDATQRPARGAFRTLLFLPFLGTFADGEMARNRSCCDAI